MERKALGRGIASLVPTAAPRLEPRSEEPAANSSSPGWKAGGLISVPIDQITANRYQPRRDFDQQKLEELAQSIREHGVLSPVILSRKGAGYELISGERRFRASSIAGLTEVPAVVRDVQPEGLLELALVENIQRADLGPLEEAAAYQELVDQFGYTQESISQRVGKDRATVANLLRLLKLPTKVKQALNMGQITVGHARALAGIPEIERQLYFCEQVMNERWSVRELEIHIAAKRVIGLKAKMKDLKPLPQHLVQILDELRRRLGTQVRLIPSGMKGKIVVEYYSEEDLDRIYEVLIH